MVGALIIVLREVIEAGIIVGIVLAVTSGVAGRGRWIAAGIVGGLLGAGCLAAFADVFANSLAGIGQELFNAGVLAIAVIMLAWHNIWMARHGRDLAAEAKGVSDAVRQGDRSLAALAIVVGVAVLREGSEVALFLYGLVVSNETHALDVFAGSALGLVAGGTLSVLTYVGLVTMSPKQLFRLTTVLITFLAAGLAAQCVHFLQQAGLVTVLQATAWDTSAFLSDRSLIGRVARTLLGYNDQPSQLQLIVYSLTLSTIFLLTFVQPRSAGDKTISSKATV